MSAIVILNCLNAIDPQYLDKEMKFTANDNCPWTRSRALLLKAIWDNSVSASTTVVSY